MKKALFIVLFSVVSAIVFSQSKINQPGLILDTTYGGVHSMYYWNLGLFEVFARDSSRIVGDTLKIYPAYFSTKSSYIRPTIIKKIIVSPGDTIVQPVHTEVDFIDILTQMKNFYSSTNLQKAIKRSLKSDYKKKVSDHVR